METKNSAPKRMPRPIILEKDEVKKHELPDLATHEKQFASDTLMVSCPKKNFGPASTNTCSGCPYFMGFFPKDRKQEISKENLYVVCSHMIGRSVFNVGE